jgi:hypothetical protein
MVLIGFCRGREKKRGSGAVGNLMVALVVVKEPRVEPHHWGQWCCFLRKGSAGKMCLVI